MDLENDNFCNTLRFEHHKNVHLENGHNSREVEKTFSCDLCQRSFETIEVLARHRRRHRNEGPGKKFQCSFCPYSTNNKTDLLQRHLPRHTGERHYSCAWCKKQFIVKCNFERHMLTHINQQPYHCESCGKNFASANAFTQHLQLHLLEQKQ